MALSIHTNYSALVTNTALNKSNNALATNQQRLGTGLRINSAADDAAGLQIATRLNAQSRGMGVAMRNVSDSVSMLQTAEGAFNEMTDIMQRMKDLATQGANGTNSDDDKAALQSEYDQLGQEVRNIMENTKYAGDALFGMTATDGKFGSDVVFQIGASADEAMTFNVVGDADTGLTALVAKLGEVSSYLGATAVTDGAPGTEIGGTDTITKLADALDLLGSVRSDFGATINRLNHTSNNLANMKDNTEMAKGRIMDADFAMESANMSKNSMLMQSGISMLKQAGQMPGMVMSLLG
ncbi:lateral flagellin LafA [Stutzerimonas nitrititolerans]|uniref:lateral flagellin LafA n=1 Tax=Stutzerimonas nitrititolerans TaxID=2482751 RepID=UPI0028A14E26|nr:lateral flagellin LafA [Stutzerimonas nitrititolerans]